MIKRIRHKGLRRYYETGDTRGITADHAPRLRLLLTALGVARSAKQLELLPGTRLHALKGELKGFWAMNVSGNWRLIFTFEGEDATDVDYLDYH